MTILRKGGQGREEEVPPEFAQRVREHSQDTRVPEGFRDYFERMHEPSSLRALADTFWQCVKGAAEMTALRIDPRIATLRSRLYADAVNAIHCGSLVSQSRGEPYIVRPIDYVPWFAEQEELEDRKWVHDLVLNFAIRKLRMDRTSTEKRPLNVDAPAKAQQKETADTSPPVARPQATPMAEQRGQGNTASLPEPETRGEAALRHVDWRTVRIRFSDDDPDRASVKDGNEPWDPVGATEMRLAYRWERRGDKAVLWDLLQKFAHAENHAITPPESERKTFTKRVERLNQKLKAHFNASNNPVISLAKLESRQRGSKLKPGRGWHCLIRFD